MCMSPFRTEALPVGLQVGHLWAWGVAMHGALFLFVLSGKSHQSCKGQHAVE